jgi:hypothetical protein
MEYQRGNNKMTIQRKTGNVDKSKTQCVGHHYTQTNTNNVNLMTCSLLQTTGGNDEPNIVLCGNRSGHHNTEFRT